MGIEKLKALKNICYLLDSKKEDFNNRNFCHSDGWDRHNIKGII